MRRILVTGGAGFIGSHLTEELVLNGYEVRVLDNFFRGKRENLASCLSRIELIEGDVTNPAVMKKAVYGVDTVFHLAAINGTSYFYEIPGQVFESSIRAMTNLVDALSGSNVERVIYASSAEVYGFPQQFPTTEDHPLMVPDQTNPRWSYGGSKIAGELMLRYCLPSLRVAPVILRYHNCYGPRMGWNHVISEFLYRMLTGTPFTIHGTGNETRSFCYISDAVNASILAATSPATLGEVLNIGNPQELRINDLVTNLEDITGIRVERHYIPFQGAGTSRRVPSITKVERLIGYVPKVNLRDGLARTSEWCRKELEKHHKLTHISDKIVIDFSTDALNSGSTVLPQQPIESSM